MQNQTIQNLVKHRPLKLPDMNFIYSTWLKSYRQSEWAKDITNDVFFSQHKEIIDKILARPTTKIIVICNPDDEDQIYGYLVHEHTVSGSIIHFAYIKYNFRKFGIMSALLGDLGYTTSVSPIFISHLPRYYDSLKTKFNLIYSPYLMFI